MTFKEFEVTVKHFRNDVKVSAHGEYSNNKCGNTLGVIFINKDGRESRVYDYSGTYSQVLAKLGITEFYTDDMIVNLDEQINRYSSMNGKKNLFTREPMDYTDKIAELEAEKAKLLTYYRAGKN